MFYKITTIFVLEPMQVYFTLTGASFGFRHVAIICCSELFPSDKYFTRPKPIPRLHPVIKIDFIMD